MAIIEIKKINKNYPLEERKQKVLSNINFSVEEKEFVCIVGPSGCGKSTLLRLISTLEKPTSGEILTAQKSIAMVFQNFALFPWLNVLQNVSFGLKMRGLPEDKITAQAKKCIRQMGLRDVENKHPKELSGGMKQRVGIARALAISPDILLLDEPFSSLDIATARTLRKELLDVWQDSGLTVLMVSHLIEEAVELSDRIIVMSSSPGEVKDIVKINLARPRQTRSTEFFQTVDRVSSMINSQ